MVLLQGCPALIETKLTRNVSARALNVMILFIVWYDMIVIHITTSILSLWRNRPSPFLYLIFKIQHWSTQPALSQMLEENPGSLIRRRNLLEELRVTELEISNLDQASKSGTLCVRLADATIDGQVPSSSSSSGGLTSKDSYQANVVFLKWENDIFINCKYRSIK